MRKKEKMKTGKKYWSIALIIDPADPYSRGLYGYGVHYFTDHFSGVSGEWF